MSRDFITTAFSQARGRLKAVARRFSSADDSLAEDMLQEAFCRLWASDKTPASVDEAEALGRVTIRNLAIDSERRLSSRRTVDIDSTSQADMIDTSNDDIRQIDELYAEVTTLIDKELSLREREILYLRDRDGWEYDELAQRFDTSEANIRVIISRARRTIRTIYLNKNK